MRLHLKYIAAIFMICLGLPGRADAHLVNSGLGPFYDGVAHVFATPEDLLVVVGLALLAGLGGKPFGRAVLFVLPATWLAGTLAGSMVPVAPCVPVLSASLLIALGALVAANARLPLAFVAGAAMMCGLLNGYFNGTTLAGVAAIGSVAAGIGCGVFVIVALVAAQVATMRKEWSRIAVRVAGSWISAIGLLMFGWAIRYYVQQ